MRTFKILHICLTPDTHTDNTVVSFINLVQLICVQDLIKPCFPARPDVADLRLAMASLGFQPHSRKIERGALEEGKKNHSALKTNLLGDPPAA